VYNFDLLSGNGMSYHFLYYGLLVWRKFAFMYDYYPVYLSLRCRKCLVVGGGNVAERKVKSLLECGANVWVVSPLLTQGLTKLLEEKQIHCLHREYIPEDLDGCFLVISATNNPDINRKVADDCFTRNIPVNVVDEPEKCNFIVPSVMRRGSLAIAISTGGKSPLLARKIRERLEGLFGAEYADYLELMGELREQIIKEVPDKGERRKIFECLVNSDILELVEKGERELVKEKIAQCLSSQLA